MRLVDKWPGYDDWLTCDLPDDQRPLSEDEMSIEDRVKQIIAEQFCIAPGEIDLAADMADKYQMDSLDQIELVITIEDEFGVEIPDEDMFAVKTAQKLIDLVRAQLAKV